ncbi:MAG: AMP-binding protein [Candidatus Latescibacterota bacterium]
MDTLIPWIERLAERGKGAAVLALQEKGARAWSYAELGEAAGRVACALRQAGVRPGEAVGLLSGARFEAIAAGLGAILAGAAVMPLDEQFGDDVLAHVLADSGARFVFATAEHRERLRRVDPAGRLTVHAVDGPAGLPAGAAAGAVADSAGTPPLQADGRAALFYTSGTTGRPKGVPLTHGNLAFQLQAVARAGLVTPQDRFLLPLPLHHVYPFVIGILFPLSLGLTVVFPRALTGPEVVRAVREARVTVFIGVPRLYRALDAGIQARARASGRLAGAVFGVLLGACVGLRRLAGVRAGRHLLGRMHRQLGPDLRLLASGGAAIDPELTLRLEALGWQVAIGYGLTETSPLLTLNVPGALCIGSVGQVVEGVKLRVAPSGEVQARGPSVFGGYLNLPEQTQAAFTPDGWFRTGDLGHFDADGYLFLQGRVSTMIVTEGGENVQPDQVEEVYDAHPFIQETGVLERERRLVALIVPDFDAISRQGGGDVAEAVRRAVRQQSEKLASYQRVSEHALTTQALARTRLGKIRRHLLPERYEAARQEAQAGPLAVGPISVEEMSDQDQALLENATARTVWEWLAERHADRRLTPDTSLQVDLGVDSLEWLNITVEIVQRAGVELDEEAIARIRSVRDLLGEVAGHTGGRQAADLPAAAEQPEEALSEEQRRRLQPLGRVEVAAMRLLYGLNRGLARLLFRLQVRGLERLPAADQLVLAPNHVSYLDAFVVAAALPCERLRRTCWAGWAGHVQRNWLTRGVTRLAQVLPVDSRRGAAGILALTAAAIRRGHSLIWFPEGARSPDGRLQPLRPGIGILLERFAARVVPVHIEGTRQAMPPGRALIRPERVTLTFGEPVETAQLAAEGLGETPRQRIVQALHARLQQMGEEARGTGHAP